MNRDSTFLALAGTALADSDTPMQERTCCNPLANTKPVCCHETSLSYAAAVTVSGLATKLEDNAEDEHGWRKHLPRLASGVIGPARDKATGVLNSCDFPTREVIKTLGQQLEIEQTGAGFMEASEPTAQSYGHIFSHLSKISQRYELGTPLFLLGSSLGRLIYWKDAVDDWAADKKQGRFNPLIHHPAEELPGLVRNEFNQLQSSVAAIPWSRHGELIESVIGHTVQHNQELMSTPSPTRKKKKKSSSWWNNADCCCLDCSGCGSPCSCGDASGGCCDSCDCCSCSCN